MEPVQERDCHEVLARMFAHLQQNLEREPTKPLSSATRLVTDLHLDSMEGAQMLSELEDHYGVTIPLSVLQRAETLGDVATAVALALQTHHHP